MDPVNARLAVPWTGGSLPGRASQDQKLTIAVINNVPDAALRHTERQFCRLLGAASHGMLIKLKFYSPPQLARSAKARAHIDQYYDDFSEIENSPPDGLIVTGTEPTTTLLDDDPCWDPISRLVDWAVDCSIPGIWSCLASHVAVLHLDGIAREPLPQKLSGVFECRLHRRSYQIVHGLPETWRVPHSRLNGLPERRLVSSGYAILSKSPDVGVDVFCRKQGALQLFFQGHPEYEQDTLIGEYRRDLRRFLVSSTDVLPAIPSACFDPETAAKLTHLTGTAKSMRDPTLMDNFDSLLEDVVGENVWFPVAKRIYMNWLSYLASRRCGSLAHRPVYDGKEFSRTAS